MLNNVGDDISFVPDQYKEGEWPLSDVTEDEIIHYKDMTDTIVDELIKNEILKDEGKEVFDLDEPEIYVRKLVNIWGED